MEREREETLQKSRISFISLLYIATRCQRVEARDRNKHCQIIKIYARNLTLTYGEQLSGLLIFEHVSFTIRKIVPKQRYA